MAGVSTGHDGGHHLNVELNLVPFIDLLSSLVMFLLVTAVWIRISVIPASVQTKGRSPQSTPPKIDQRLNIHLSPNHIGVQLPASLGRKKLTLANKDQAYDMNGLITALKALSGQGKVTGAAVSADEEVNYGDVVTAIDAAKTGGIVSVALSAN